MAGDDASCLEQLLPHYRHGTVSLPHLLGQFRDNGIDLHFEGTILHAALAKHKQNTPTLLSSSFNGNVAKARCLLDSMQRWSDKRACTDLLLAKNHGHETAEEAAWNTVTRASDVALPHARKPAAHEIAILIRDAV